MRPELWRKAGIPQIKNAIIAQFGSVIPNAGRELTRSNDVNIRLSRSLTAFGMTDLWETKMRYFFVAEICGRLKFGPFSWPGFVESFGLEYSPGFTLSDLVFKAA